MVFEMVDEYVRDNIVTSKIPMEQFILSKVAYYLVEADGEVLGTRTKIEFGLRDTITAQGFGYKEFVDFSEGDEEDYEDDMGGIKVTLGPKDITPDIY
jgi:hypothetical protein